MAVSLLVAAVHHPRLAPGAGGIGRSRRPSVWCQSDGAPNPSSDKVFIFGMGYTALALANTLQKRGWEVAGTCRSEEKREALQQRGFRAHFFNDNDARLREDAILELQQASHIVSSIPPVGDFDCDPVLAALDELALHQAQWIGYLSSTSVYGDWQGGWVDEQTEPRPADAKAATRREAERSWLCLGADVFRLGGIYGPGRSALDTVARESERLSARQRARTHKRFTSRVHVADICQVVVKAMVMASGKRASRVFNVVDDDPSPRSDVMAYARQLLRRPNPPPEVELGFSSSSRVAEKRVSNRRIKEELHVELLHPSFRSGLEAIARGSNHPFD